MALFFHGNGRTGDGGVVGQWWESPGTHQLISAVIKAAQPSMLLFEGFVLPCVVTSCACAVLRHVCVCARAVSPQHSEKNVRAVCVPQSCPLSNEIVLVHGVPPRPLILLTTSFASLLSMP